MILRLDHIHFINNSDFIYNLIILTFLTLFTFYNLNFYKAVIRFITGKFLKNVFFGVLFSSIFLYLNSFIFDFFVPRSVPIMYFSILLILTGGSRLLLKEIHFTSNNLIRKPIVIYGAGDKGRQILNSLIYNPQFKPLFFIDDNVNLQNIIIQELPVYSFEKAKEKIKKQKIKLMILSFNEGSNSFKSKIFNELKNQSIEFVSLNDYKFLAQNKVNFNNLKTFSIEDLLNRTSIKPNANLMKNHIKNKTIFVSGGGGSIGSKICEEVLRYQPENIILMDNSELALYKVTKKLKKLLKAYNSSARLCPILGNVLDKKNLEQIFNNFKIDIIYHTAAYKHVSIVEANVIDGIKNNVIGTFNLINSSIKFKCKHFILISSDKAVNPTNYMGLSKKLSEYICKYYSNYYKNICISTVRFGNVFGSSGSVIPLFNEQIRLGGPVTVTHPKTTRYFMTITEASQLVIQAGSMAKGGEIFVLDMGKPLKIIELAKKMIRLNGLEPYQKNKNEKGDIEIKITGLKKGEKLHEQLYYTKKIKKTKHPKILKVDEIKLNYNDFKEELDKIILYCQKRNIGKLKATIFSKKLSITDIENKY